MIGYDLPVGRRTAFFAWVGPEAGHVHLGFPQGVFLADPAGVLDGRGVTKRARWFTVRAGEPIPTALYAGFVRDAARIARLSSSERGAILLDREARYLPVDQQDSKLKPR